MTKKAPGADGTIKTEDELKKIAEDLEKEKPENEEVDDDDENEEKPSSEQEDGESEDGDEDEDQEDSESEEDESDDEDDDADEQEDDNKGDDESKSKSKDDTQEKSKKKLADLTPEETRQKLIDSSREAQILYARNKQVQDAIVNANNIPAPTDDEMRKEFPNWDKLDDFSKRMARDNITNSRRLEAVTAVTQDFKDQDAWMEKVDKYIENPEVLAKTPDLDGLQDEFKKFASLPTRRGVDFNDLVSAFLYEREKNKPAKKKGKMFPNGSGGVKVDKKPTKLTASEAATLRKTNYPKFIQLLKAGKINSSEL